MSFMDKYSLRLSKSNGSIRQSNIDTTRQFMNYAFRDDPTYYKVPLNGVETEMRIYDKNSTIIGYGHKYIQLLDNTLPPLGGYILWNERYWLITNTDESNELNVRGTIRECNYLLKWINDNGEIIERWGIFYDSTKYSTGENSNKTLITGNMRYELNLPKDSETVKLPRDKRFIIDDYDHAQVTAPTVFSISKTNLIQSNRLGDAVFIYIMQEATFNSSRDNRELMIADYYEGANLRPSELSQITSRCRINSPSEPVILIGGAAKTFTAAFCDENGNAVSGTADWTVYDDTDVNPLYISVLSADNDRITLRCSGNYKLNGKVIYLKLIDSNGLNSDVLEIELVNLA